MNTPWGRSWTCAEIADGITLVSTAGHGGVKLSPERNALVPEAMRQAGGWYEEDCEINFSIWTFPVEFAEWSCTQNYPTDSPYRDAEASKEKAAEAIRQWFPDQWTAATGEVVTADQSHVIKEREFYASHAGDWLTSAAWGDWHDEVPEGMVGVVARVGGRPNPHGMTGYFLVPEDEYDARGIAFVIDLERHEAWPTTMTTTTKQVRVA